MYKIISVFIKHIFFFQGQISYATYSSTKTTNLFDLWAGVTEEIMPRRNSIQELEGKLPLLNIKTCFK